MSYTALYRKFRPGSFDEVKGQDHIVTTLKNQIKSNRIGHAYLFTGTRGTGKTSVAKIFAKSVNCENPIEGSPCGECSVCRAIAAGVSMNVIEIDAASNNGVDNIREIVDEVSYSPTEGKYKVYIIDEVHMLSIGAFNALLKTLEEPPSYVIFILATTEYHKIPITVLSRCQRYDFRRISLETIYERLADLLQRENIAAEEKAIRYVAKAADGSMRDALSLLDQCIAFYLGQTLTYEKVLEVLGAVDVDVFNQLMECIAKNDTMSALKVVEEIIWQGRELSQFVNDFTWYMRNMLLIKSSSEMTDQLDMSEEDMASVKAVADQISIDSLMRYIRVFSELSNQIRYATQKRVTLELAVIKLTTPQMETNLESVLERIRLLEDKVENGAFSVSEEQLQAMSAMQANNIAKAEPDINREEIVKKELTPAQQQDMKQIVECIKNIKQDENARNQLGYGTTKYLNEASVNIGADHKSIVLSFDNSQIGSMAYDQFMKEEHIQVLKDLIAQQLGKTVEIACLKKNSLEEKDISTVNLMNMNFNLLVEE